MTGSVHRSPVRGVLRGALWGRGPPATVCYCYFITAVCAHQLILHENLNHVRAGSWNAFLGWLFEHAHPRPRPVFLFLIFVVGDNLFSFYFLLFSLFFTERTHQKQRARAGCPSRLMLVAD